MRTSKTLAASAGVLGVAVAATAIATAAPPPGPPLPKSASGAQVERIAGPGAIPVPTAFAFGKGTVFVGSASAEKGKPPPRGGVFTMKNGQATLIPKTPKNVFGVAWKAGKLYVSSGRQLLAYGGWDGTKFAAKKVLYTAHKKSLPGINGIAFGPNGRLYAGAGLDDKYDHKTDTRKYAQAVLSFKRDGSDIRIVAQGLRQPFQLAFVKGDRYPYVSNESEGEAKAPPDFIVHARPGEDYGFAKCTRLKPKTCKDYARPFKLLAPHSSPTGVAASGTTLYIAEFSGQRVVKMSVKTKKVKKVLTGFAAPVVGLGIHGSSLYVGDVTGSVYKTKK